MHNTLHYNITLATVIVGTLTVLGYWYRKRKQNAIPDVWKTAGKVTGLCMYPLKSGRRMELKEAECTEYGLKLVTDDTPHLRDRCLVVYKEGSREFRTAREYPKLFLVETTAADKDSFLLKAPNMKTLRLKIPKLEKENIGEVYMWSKENIFTIDCGNEAAQWFSNYLEGKTYGLRLGFHDGQHWRDIGGYHKNQTKVYPIMKNMSSGMYNDLTSILLLGQASVDDLKSRVSNSNISVHNFRPNIVIGGNNLAPYAEDKFNWVKIGDSVFRFVKACPRCSVITIDPETTIRAKDYEPHKTLKSYRKMYDVMKIKLDGEDPVIGIKMCIVKCGKISVGDTVYIG